MIRKSKPAKRGAPIGNTNAAVDYPKSCRVIIRLSGADFWAWKLHAEQAGLPLVSWVRAKINESME